MQRPDERAKFPDLDMVLKDLQNFEESHKRSLQNVTTANKQLTNLQFQRETLRDSVNTQKSLLVYYEKVFADLVENTEVILMNKQQTKLAHLANKKLVEDFQSKMSKNVNTYPELQIIRPSKLEAEGDDLKKKIYELEQQILNNATQLKEKQDKLNL